jgi:hypothetical protein
MLKTIHAPKHCCVYLNAQSIERLISFCWSGEGTIYELDHEVLRCDFFSENERVISLEDNTSFDLLDEEVGLWSDMYIVASGDQQGRETFGEGKTTISRDADLDHYYPWKMEIYYRKIK